MRKIIWSPKAFQDYTSIIDYLHSTWTTKEIQQFIDKVMSALSALEKGNFDFKRVGVQDYRMIVIQKQVSIIYRSVTINEVQIIRIWDNRQNPVKLK
jgi:plasmid stabilization system protein ParE